MIEFIISFVYPTNIFWENFVPKGLRHSGYKEELEPDPDLRELQVCVYVCVCAHLVL